MVIQELARTDRYDVIQGGGVNKLRRELARTLVSEPPSPLVRQEIVDSWRQSVAVGLVPDRLELPYDGSLEQDSSLERAAKPVVDQLGAELAFTEISVVALWPVVQPMSHMCIPRLRGGCAGVGRQ